MIIRYQFRKAEKQRRQEKQGSVPRETREESVLGLLHDLAYIIAVTVLLCLLCFRVVVVSGPSMYHTLVDGDYLLLLNNSLYKEPRPGDIVVAGMDRFEDGQPIVKRVIATEGQEVDIDFDRGVVYVDGVALEEDYTNTPTTLWEGTSFPLTVEEGHVFLMGDNRNDSLDSRDPRVGQVDTREILGKAVLLFLPGTNYGREARDFTRIGGLD